MREEKIILTHTFSGSKLIGVGALLGPDQNGVPDEVTASFGKLYKSCKILFLKSSSNFNRAHAIHSSNESGFAVTRKLQIDSRTSR